MDVRIENFLEYIAEYYNPTAMEWTDETSETKEDCFLDGYACGQSTTINEIAKLLGIDDIEDPIFNRDFF